MAQPTFTLPLDSAGVTSRETLETAVNAVIDVIYDDAAPVDHDHPAADISDSTAAGRALLTAADAPAQRTALGLGTAATTAAADYATAAQGATADSAVQPGDDVDALAETATAKIMTGAERTKLAAIEAGADVTDTANVTAAGALMDSEVISLSGVKSLVVPDATTISGFAKTVLDDADAAAMRATLGLGTAATTPATDYAPASHTQAASTISDSTAAGRSLLTAADAGAQRTALGLGTAATADVGDFPTAAQISDEADARDLADVVQAWRPGENPTLFSEDTTGEPGDRVPLAIGTVAVAADGAVLRLTGADSDPVDGYAVVAPRAAYALELDRVYRARAVVQRVVDPGDPAGHGVELRARNLSASKTSVSNVALAASISLTVAMGRTEIDVLICRGTPPSGVTAYSPPSTTRYMTPHLRIYGNGATTDVEVIEWVDVSDSVVGGADVAMVIADLADETAARIAGDAANDGAIDAHVARTDNPHSVTKTQVGLSVVDNTADADKPVSAAQAAAIAAEAARATGVEAVLRRAAGMTIPVIGFAMMVAASTQWNAGGEMVGAVRLPDLAASARSFVVPQIGDAVAATYSTGGDAVAVLRSGRVFTVPQIGLARAAHMLASGQFASVRTDYPKAHMVPRIGGAAAAQFNAFGDAVDVTLAEAPATDVEQRLVAGQITGRVVPQVMVKRTDAAWIPVTAGPFGAEIVEIDADAGAGEVRRGGVVHPVRWRSTPLSDGATMHLALIVGQSLAQGFTDTSPATNGAFDRYPAWRDLVGERAWQFKAGDGIQRGPRPFQLAPNFVNRNVSIASTQLETLEPLRGALHAEDEGFAQTTAESLAAALLGQHLHPRDHVLTAIVGTGATAIANFAVGTAHMASVEAVIAAAAAQATARGKALKVWLIWNQGEQDNSDGTAQAAYEAAWIAIRDHIEAEAIAAGGTYGGAVIQQCSQRPGGATGMATLAHAALVATGEAVAVPVYPMRPGHSGGAHLFPATYLPLGSATAWAISRLMEAGSTSPYVAAGGATLVNSTTIDCVFSSRDGVMQFDTATIPDDGQYGVRVSTTGGLVDIDAFEWTGAGTLRLTLAEAVVIGDVPVVRFGLAGSSALLPGASGPRVNIRDGSEWPCPITGQIVSGWVLQHQVAVTA